MSEVLFNVPICRVSKLADGRVLVEGTATSEAIVNGLLLTHESNVAAMAAWAGNIREMHKNEAVGRAIEVTPDDEKRLIRIKAFVSKGAPNTQEKVLDGTLRAFSIGGEPKEWEEKEGYKRVTAWVCKETSLVDVGADPNTNDLRVVLTRGLNLEPGLIGQEATMADTDATASVTTEPTSTTTVIGDRIVTVSPDGSTVVKPIERAAEPAKVEAAPVAVEAPKAKPVNRYSEALKHAESEKESTGRCAHARGADMEDCAKCGCAQCDCDDCTGADCGCCENCSDCGNEENRGDCSQCDCKTCTGAGCDCCDKCAAADEEKRKEFTAKEREKAADEGTAMKDGSFPIRNASDLSNAIKAVGRAKDPAAAKAHIKKRAKALGLTDKLPQTWRSARPEMVRATIATLQRYMQGGDETDDLAMAIGLLRQIGWVSEGLEQLIACELAESLEGQDESAQITILQGAKEHLDAACSQIKEFIGDEAAEGTAQAAEPEPEAAQPADQTREAEGGMESAARPQMTRLLPIVRRLKAIESKLNAPPAEALTATDGEQLTVAVVRGVVESTKAELARVEQGFERKLEALGGTLQRVLDLPAPFGVARTFPTKRTTAAGGKSEKVKALEDMLSRADALSSGFLRVELARAIEAEKE